jgi:hypothetical protein
VSLPLQGSGCLGVGSPGDIQFDFFFGQGIGVWDPVAANGRFHEGDGYSFRGFRVKSVFILLARVAGSRLGRLSRRKAAEFRRPIVCRSSLCAVPPQFHDDLALVILLSDIQWCLSCSVLGIYVITVAQQPSNQQQVANAAVTIAASIKETQNRPADRRNHRIVRSSDPGCAQFCHDR